MLLGLLTKDTHNSNDILTDTQDGFNHYFSDRGEEIEATLDFLEVVSQIISDYRKENDMILVQSFPGFHKADHVQRQDGRVMKIKQAQHQSGIDESLIKKENPKLFEELERKYPRVSRRGTVERPLNLADEVKS